MAKFVGIIGDTGSGKSRSILNLDPKSTIVISVLNKPLPFKSANKIYNKENNNYVYIKDYSSLKNIT